jgi:uncharacterized delta-60 repeat protein
MPADQQGVRLLLSTRRWMTELGRGWCVGALVAALLASVPAHAATSTTVVGVSIPSATSLALTGCGTGSDHFIDLGLVLPGSTSLSPVAGCQLTWGSSNDTATLRLWQADGAGSTMYRPALGSFDSAFDGNSGSSNGKVSTSWGASDEAQDLARDASGRVVVVGLVGSSAWGIARYDASGVLDPTFGTGGKFTYVHGGTSTASLAVAIQPDGAIVVSGTVSNDFTTLRLTSNGALDPKFDTDGIRVDDIVGSDQADDLVLQPDGKALVLGMQNSNASGTVVRYTAAGALDTSFGGGDGVQQVSWGAGSNEVMSGALQADGSLVVAGRRGGDFGFARLLADGSLDPAFDGPAGTGNGKFSVSVTAGNDDVDNVLLQPDGGIVAAGTADTTAAKDAALVRLLPADGSLDPTFDGPAGTGNGVFAFDIAGADNIDDLFLQPDGRLVVGGSTAAANEDVELARLLPTGAFDTSFAGPGGSGSGRFSFAIGAGDDNLNAVVQGVDGSIDIAGYTNNTDHDYLLASLGGTKVNDFASASFDWTTTGPGNNAFGACVISSANATPQGGWTPDPSNDCGDGNSDPWNAVPSSSTVIASSAATVTNAVTRVRFGLRAASDQPAGSYVAPVAIEVLAP